MALSPKRMAFVAEYLIDLNGAAAARRAGYSERSARIIAHQLLALPEVKEAVDCHLKARLMSADEVLYRLTQHAMATLADCITIEVDPKTDRRVAYIDPVKAMDSGAIAFVKKITEEKGRYSVELEDRLSALTLLGKYHRLLTDRVAVVDWRDEARSAGLDPDEFYEQAVGQAVEALKRSREPASS